MPAAYDILFLQKICGRHLIFYLE